MLSVHYFCVKISQLLTCNVKATLIKIALAVVAFSFNEWTASSFVQNGNDIFYIKFYNSLHYCGTRKARSTNKNKPM